MHVAGTKGKGSTAAMIAGVLTAAGLSHRAVQFAAPRPASKSAWRSTASACPTEELIELVERIAAVLADGRRCRGDRQTRTRPTYFEIVTALALLQFAEQRVDAAVLEVGLGGRLDSTNVCQPLVSVITSISFDHTQQLGNTLAAIAGEKAGIIKPGVPVVSGVIDRRAARRDCGRSPRRKAAG